MMISGTRGAISVPFAGFDLLYWKNIKILGAGFLLH
jgi:hypothetical protein